jgi:hypothetical protein
MTKLAILSNKIRDGVIEQPNSINLFNQPGVTLNRPAIIAL